MPVATPHVDVVAASRRSMGRLERWRRPVALAGVVAAAAVGAAAGAAPVSASSGGPDVEVIAGGLDNPRGLTVVHGDTVLVTEAGRGGDGPCIMGSAGAQVCLGQTGAVTAVRRAREHTYVQRRIVTLPSLASPTEALGPHDVAIGSSGELVVALGLGAPPASRAQLGEGGALLGQLVRVDSFGRIRPVADLAAFEAAHDPDQGLPGTHVDSNPYGLHVTGHGVFAADAGGNTVLRIGRGGVLSPIAVFAPRFVAGPDPGSQIPMQSVPTSVTRGSDGALYVGELTGFPFPVGGAKVWRLERGEQPQVYAEGFTNIVDIAFDRRGRLHVLEMFKNGILAPPPEGQLPPGRLVRVERDGSKTEIADGALNVPGSLAFGSDGSIYVSNKSSAGPGAGEVLRIRTHP
ncbi:MAG: hypothetical protein QOI98_3437 [Solirubrobacteraceae bacterium]|jgi:hypothetical protein|nr:hypothetical protein [Solirubrobacteraceae bacterium]